MTTELYERLPLEHHQQAPTTEAAHRQSFSDLLADSVRQIRDKSENLTRKESQLLSDITRRTYSDFRVIAEVADIARHRCKDPGAAASLAESIRGYTLAGHPGLILPFFDVIRYEGATNAIADEALVEHLLRPSKASRERMVEAHVAQAIASRAVADLMYGKER